MKTTPHEQQVISVWVLEDHDVFAKHLQRLIGGEEDMECEVRFASAPELFDRLEKVASPPHVLVLDIGLPGMNGLEVLARMSSKWPAVRIMVLSSSDDRENVYHAICNGASGYILKTSDPDEIVGGIREVHHGAAPLSSQVASMILKGFARLGPVSSHPEPLTSREEEVLRFLVKGLIKKEIAVELGISQHTVDMHLRAVYRKLHVRSQTEAVSMALRRGLV